MTLLLPANYSGPIVELVKSGSFDAWLTGLRDRKAGIRIQVRLDRLAMGNAGDVQPVGEGISELRIDYGPGYRVYFMRRGQLLIVLLCGGDKTTQVADIKAAKRIAKDWKD